MSRDLTTAAELAELFGISLRRLHDLRRENGWPCIRLGKSDFRFTEAQVAQIIAMQTEEPKRANRPRGLPGQTKRSTAMRSA